MTIAFDPAQHILVVRDKDSGKHQHVKFSDVIQQVQIAAAVPAPAATVTEPALVRAISDAATAIARLADRIAKLEADYVQHSHDYRLSEDQLQVIASAVLEQIRRAGLRVA